MAASAMQSVMSKSLQLLINKSQIIVCMNGICIFTDTLEMHINIVSEVLKTL